MKAAFLYLFPYTIITNVLRRTWWRPLLFLMLFMLIFAPQALAWTISSITHTWAPNPSGQTFNNAILTKRCLTANYHWLASSRLSPNPAQLGAWKYGTIDGCVSHYPVIELTDQTVKICVGANDSDPGGTSALYEHNNNRCSVCTRWNGGTGNGITCNEVFNIYGRITTNNGTAIAGVIISDGAGHTATTNSSGDYSFKNLKKGTYTLTPSMSGYTFSPVSLSVSGGPPYNKRNQNFGAFVSISGRVINGSGSPIAGVTVSDGVGHTATTNENGDYTLAGLNSGVYTITPSQSGYTFSPVSRTLSVPPSATGQIFTGTTSATYAASGRVIDGNSSPVAGVTVADGTGRVVTTDNDGNYTLNGLTTGSYTLTPSKNGYAFSPASRPVTVPPDATDQDFTAAVVYGSLNGRITNAGNGAKIAEARVSVGGKIVYTNSNGDYTFNNNLLPGEHKVYISADGYQANNSGRITIQPNVVTTFNTTLKPISTDGYRLPYPAGKTYKCSQGNNGRVSHYGSAYYAFDFGMSGGKEIVATRAGKVIGIEEDFSSSCYNWTNRSCSKTCLNSANYVKILHADNTVSVYYHFQKDGVLVSKNQRVASGQVIGRAGNTGCSTAAHLHYQRNKSHTNQSTKTSFLDVATNGGIPQVGKWYTSDNRLIASLDIGPLADIEPPQGSVKFKLTGQLPYTVQIDAFDYESDTIQMRIAPSESDLQTAEWQPFDEAIIVDWPFNEVYAQFQDSAGNISPVYADVIETISYEPIQASFTISPTVCVGQQLPLINQTVPFCEQCGWNWSLGNGITSEEAEPQFEFVGEYPVFSYDAPGIYTISLAVANVDSIYSTSRQVEAVLAPSPEFSLTRSDNTITVEAVEADAVSWQWDFGDGYTATGRNATHTYASPEILEQSMIELRIGASSGCVSIGQQFMGSNNANIYLPIIIK